MLFLEQPQQSGDQDGQWAELARLAEDQGKWRRFAVLAGDGGGGHLQRGGDQFPRCEWRWLGLFPEGRGDLGGRQQEAGLGAIRFRRRIFRNHFSRDDGSLVGGNFWDPAGPGAALARRTGSLRLRVLWIGGSQHIQQAGGQRAPRGTGLRRLQPSENFPSTSAGFLRLIRVVLGRGPAFFPHKPGNQVARVCVPGVERGRERQHLGHRPALGRGVCLVSAGEDQKLAGKHRHRFHVDRQPVAPESHRPLRGRGEILRHRARRCDRAQPETAPDMEYSPHHHFHKIKAAATPADKTTLQTGGDGV